MPRRAIPADRHCAEIDGRTIVYRVVGAGPPVVLVHGLAASGRWWDRNLAALAVRHRVLVVDLPGFGTNRDRASFTLADAPALLAAWLDLMQVRQAAWIGHSMGGRVVAELAADAPRHVSRLVLVDAAIFPAAKGWSLRVRGLPGAVRHVPPTLLPLVAADAARAGPRTLLRASRSLLTTGIESRLPAIVAPTLVLWGEHDAIVPLPYGERVAALIPQARLLVLPGADHTPMWGHASAFNAHLLDFLAEGRACGDAWC